MKNKKKEAEGRAGLILCLLLLIVLQGKGQHVFESPRAKTHKEYFGSYIYNNPTFLLKEIRYPDSALVANLKYFARYYAKEPVALQGCSYFFPNQKSNPFAIDTVVSSKPVTKSFTILHSNGKSEVIPDMEEDPVQCVIPDNIYPYYDRNFPAFFRYYADTSLVSISQPKAYPGTEPFFYLFLNKKSFSEIYRPFYFKNTEVSNAEYKEFVHWVTDSIKRTLLIHAGLREYRLDSASDADLARINWKTRMDTSELFWEAVEPLYLSKEERFYHRRELDTRKINYAYRYFPYENHPPRAEKTVINIYPDTLCWMHDFTYSFNEPMTNMYFWHPAYDNYPVVGITREQAEAFLHWKTARMQQQLDATHQAYTVEYDLPAEYQWEMAGTAKKSKQGEMILDKHGSDFQEESFLTDLQLANADTVCQSYPISGPGEHETQGYLIRHKMALEDDLHPRNYFIGDGYFHTAPVDYKQAVEDMKKRKKNNYEERAPMNEKNALSVFSVNQDPNGICYMGGNVSEWMKETYKDNWLPVYTKRRELLKKLKGKDVVMLLALEDYYNSLCDTNGVLVRGANWYDERYQNMNGKNMPGMMAKTFVNPQSAHSTLGFRYVVRVKRKDEDAVLKKK